VSHNNVVIVPGWHGSGPTHWQTIWQQNHPEYVRVCQKDWQSTHRADWVLAVNRTVLSLSGNVVLVAHSLGCLAVVWWAASRTDCARRVDGAVLVAPPDLSSAPGALPALSSFTPLPLARLPFPSLLVASENDPFVSIEAAARFARQWGSEFVNEGAAGHINVDSGHGAWPEGERRFQRFLDAVSATSSAASAHARF
jgi:predicted alpha/beta hydrolase family esterase